MPPAAHDSVSPVMFAPQSAWQPQPLSPVDHSQYAQSPVGSSVASPSHSCGGSPLSHVNSPVGVCSPTAVHSPHVQAHSPGMQAGSPVHCQTQSLVNIKQELSGAPQPPADFGNCNNLTHLLRGGPPDFVGVGQPFVAGLNCHLVPPAQREILDGELCVFACVIQ